ncbi:MAG: hypothetical protein V3S56_08020 [Gemmatimonadota bacterium]
MTRFLLQELRSGMALQRLEMGGASAKHRPVEPAGGRRTGFIP